MIEVFRHNTYYKRKHEIKYAIYCYSCGCGFYYNDFDRHGYAGLYEDRYVTCPECGKWLRHSDHYELVKGDKNETK